MSSWKFYFTVYHTNFRIAHSITYDRQKLVWKYLFPDTPSTSPYPEFNRHFTCGEWRAFQEITSLLGSLAYEPPAPPVGLLRNDAPFPERAESCRSSTQRPTRNPPFGLLSWNRKTLHNTVSPMPVVSRLQSTDMMVLFGKLESNIWWPPRKGGCYPPFKSLMINTSSMIFHDF